VDDTIVSNLVKPSSPELYYYLVPQRY